MKIEGAGNNCLLDTATGKVWRLELDGRLEPEKGKWVLFAEGPK
jgi:hypothetical protein